MEKEWSSKKYKRAANKHYQTCIYLINQLDLIDKEKQPHLISNLYYLSGYVLECIFKSYLLDLHHYKKKYSLEEISNFGLQTHNLNLLWERHILIKSDLRKQDFIWTNLSKKWDVVVRYETDNTEYIDLQSVKHHFNQTVKPIYEKIKNKY